jgi:TfoX/Sxy family transcriptional regulator of competence genes
MKRAALITIYDRLIARHAGIARKGKATAYTAMNGNMFSFVGPEGELCIRLSKYDKTAFGDQFGDEPVVRYNSVMDGYVTVPDELLTDHDLLAAWFAKSVAFAADLKPKPTKKKN